MMREIAWRVFAREDNDSTKEVSGGGERGPSSVGKPPALVAVTGKSRLFSPEPGTTYASIRPEEVKIVDEGLRDYWILEACRSLRKRLRARRGGQRMGPR